MVSKSGRRGASRAGKGSQKPRNVSRGRAVNARSELPPGGNGGPRQPSDRGSDRGEPRFRVLSLTAAGRRDESEKRNWRHETLIGSKGVGAAARAVKRQEAGLADARRPPSSASGAVSRGQWT